MKRVLRIAYRLQSNGVQSTNFSWAFLLIDKNPTEVGTLNACLLATMSNLLGFGQTSQTQHRNHSKQWPGRKYHEGIAPAHKPLDTRNQLNRNRRQQKSQTRLNRQGGADVLWIRSEEHTSELQSPCNLV